MDLERNHPKILAATERTSFNSLQRRPPATKDALNCRDAAVIAEI
jgi:hypothetical protein